MRYLWILVLLAACIPSIESNKWFPVETKNTLKIVNNTDSVVTVVVVAPDLKMQRSLGNVTSKDSVTWNLPFAETPIDVNINGTTYKIRHNNKPMEYRLEVTKP